MKFNCFPKKQEMFLIYTNYRVFKSRLFKDLILQSSPKNSIFYRILKTRIGFLISSIFKCSIELPHNNDNCVGIIKGKKFIIFELDDSVNPVYVWKKDRNDSWSKENFIGFQLISEYTLSNFNKNSLFIEKAFALHWKKINRISRSHGDFTHFNILIDKNEKIHFIDDKSHENSRIFDFFYFYSYYNQCLFRCKTINNVDKEIILNKLIEIIVRVCSFSNKNSFINEMSEIKLPEKWGLTNIDKLKYLEEFKNRMILKIQD